MSGDDLPLVPRSFITRAVYSRDGVDVSANFFFRNRGREAVSFDIVKAEWQIAGVERMSKARVVAPSAIFPEKEISVGFPPVRLFSPTPRLVQGRFTIDFWLNDMKRYEMDVSLYVEIGDFPTKVGVDAAVGVVEWPKAQYRVVPEKT